MKIIVKVVVSQTSSFLIMTMSTRTRILIDIVLNIGLINQG